MLDVVSRSPKSVHERATAANPEGKINRDSVTWKSRLRLKDTITHRTHTTYLESLDFRSTNDDRPRIPLDSEGR